MNDVPKSQPDSNDLAEYIASITSRRMLEPVLLFEASQLQEALQKNGGATAISAADILKPFQFHSELYFGVTTPAATTEIPHWHTDQWEAYALINGLAEITVKHWWLPDGWIRKMVGPGDLLLIRPEVCHWFRWRSPSGLCYVFKAPQRAGIGPFPSGKVTCQRGCPAHGHSCVYPAGWHPDEK